MLSLNNPSKPMSYRARQKAEQRYKSARLSRFSGRMVPTEELEDGTVVAYGAPPVQSAEFAAKIQLNDKGQPVATICRDETRRGIWKTGKEDAFVEACRQVKVAVVPVLVPKSKGEKGRHQVEAVLGGMQLERDLTMQEWIGYEQAQKRYSRWNVDACTKTDSAKTAGNAGV